MAGSGDDRGRLRAAYLDQKDRSSRCSPPPTGPREGRCQRQLPSSARRFRARHRASALSTQEWNELRSAARPPETSRGRSGHGRVQAGSCHAPVQSSAYHLKGQGWAPFRGPSTSHSLAGATDGGTARPAGSSCCWRCVSRAARWCPSARRAASSLSRRPLRRVSVAVAQRRPPKTR